MNIKPNVSGCLMEDKIMLSGKTIGGTEGKEKKDTVDHCAEWCGETPECKFWTYTTQTKKCALKSSDAGRTIIPGKISGNKNCAKGK